MESKIRRSVGVKYNCVFIIMKQLTREQALQRLDNPDNLFNIINKKDYSEAGKSENRNKNGENGNFTQEQRDLAVALASELGQDEAANLVGCNGRTIGNWKRGVTSHSARQENNVSGIGRPEVLQSNREKAGEIAAEKVLESLNLIDDGRLRACNAVELATVAAKLSGLNGKDAANLRGSVNVNIYVPQIKSEKQFQVVEVSND